jgi:hypothetical protein
VYADNERTEETRRDEEKHIDLVYILGHRSPSGRQKNFMNDDPTLIRARLTRKYALMIKMSTQ